MNPSPTFVPFDVLPEAREWRVGKSYRTKMVLKETAQTETGANFDIVDATSLEPNDKANQHFLSDGGTFFSRK